MKQLSLVALLVLFSAPAMAYVGPGLGMGVIGTIFGVLAAIVLALFGLFWYPLKRAFNRRKAVADDRQSATAITENEQTSHLGTSPIQLDDLPEIPSDNHSNNQPSALNQKSDAATAPRADSQLQ